MTPLLVTELLLSSVTAAPPFLTEMAPLASMVMFPAAVVASAVEVPVEMVVSARAAMAEAHNTAAAAESIKRCLLKSNLIVRQQATLKLRYPAFLRRRTAPRRVRRHSRHRPGLVANPFPSFTKAHAPHPAMPRTGQ
jgi:hypothetical protein